MSSRNELKVTLEAFSGTEASTPRSRVIFLLGLTPYCRMPPSAIIYRLVKNALDSHIEHRR